MEAAIDGQMVERRRAPRSTLAAEHGIVGARIRPGYAALVLDVSAGGAFIETSRRLLPGSAIDLLVDGGDRGAVVRGRVLRCFVASIASDIVRYRAALAFAGEFRGFTRLSFAGKAFPSETRGVPWAVGSADPPDQEPRV
jgi:hypothetical protein